MIAVPSSEFLKEFTLYADRLNETDDTLIIQRANGKNLACMSLDALNALQKELFLARQENHLDNK